MRHLINILYLTLQTVYCTITNGKLYSKKDNIYKKDNINKYCLIGLTNVQVK
jgi:hypothetical protein